MRSFRWWAATLFMQAAVLPWRAAAAPQWFSAWSAPQGDRIAAPMSGTSVRIILQPTISGTAVRVRIENMVGQAPVAFASAWIGQVLSGAALVPGSNTQLTFNGSPILTLDPGEGATSDPLPFAVTAFQRYAVSLDVTASSDISGHALGLVTNYQATGAHASEPGAAAFTAVPNGDTGSAKGPGFPFYWVSALDVQSGAAAGTVVAFGDSITDGMCSTRTNNGAATGIVLPDLYNRWTDLLASRFSALPAGQIRAVADEGIAGNQLIAGGVSPGLARLDNDLFGREGTTHVIFLQGTDDLANGAAASALIAALQQVINAVHAQGLKIIGVPLIPRGGSNAWTTAMEQQRVAVNNWIRNQANYDGLIDFDALLAGPVNSGNNAVTIQPQWACFDGIHPNSAGYAAMSAAIDLNLFQGGVTGAVQYVPDSTTPLLQLNGENFQISANATYFTAPTNSRTLSTSGVVGTDLAYPVTLPDKILFLFGDTFGAYQNGGKYYQSASVGPNGADDSIAFIPNADLSQCHYIGDIAQQLAQGNTHPNVSYGACPALHYYAIPNHTAAQHIFQAIQISGLLPGEGEGPFRTPSSGLVANNRLYMFYITQYQDTSASGTPHFALQSIVARSDQDPETWSDTNPPTFTRLYTVSSHPAVTDPANPPPQAGDTGEFMFNPVVKMDAATLGAAGLTQGLPPALQSAASVVFIFGSSYQYNRSNLYLAALALSDIEGGTARWFYYAGPNQWSTRETDALPLLPGTPQVGNHSVVWNSALQRFILMHNESGGIQAQFAVAPWGPWTDPIVIFQHDDAWGSKLLHHQGDQIVRSLNTVYDSTGIPVNYGTDPGALYSPNLLDKFTQNADGSVTVYYTVSTWNPYEVFLVSSTFTTGPSAVPALTAGSAANGLTYLPGGLVPGSWAQVKGTNLARAHRIWAAPDFAGLGNKLPTTLSQTSVLVNGIPAALYFIDPGQVNFQVPAGVSGAASMQVISGGLASNVVTAAAVTSSPGIVPIIVNGVNYAGGVFLDKEYVGDPAIGSSFRKARPGDKIQLYATGLGPSPAGVATTFQSVSGVTVTIGSITFAADAAGLVAPGEFQINFTVPQQFAAIPEGNYPLTIAVNGVSSPMNINSNPPAPLVIPIQH